MKSFEEVKNYVVDEATKKGACSSELNRVKKATDKAQILSVVADNLGWVSTNNLFNGTNIGEFFTDEELIATGLYNSGEGNSGFANTGNWNTGDRNTGNWNTGNWNTGNCNTGYRNTGYSNTGNWNTGNCNTGNWNTGNWNTGNCNTGNWNTGYRNTGYSNTGNWNTGVFCTGVATLPFFDKPSDWTLEDFQNSRAFSVMNRLETKFWIWSENMSDDEKKSNPQHETTGGYLKDIPVKEAWTNLWGNLSDTDKNSFKELPNWDSGIFERITGIKFD